MKTMEMFPHNRKAAKDKFNELCIHGSWNDLSINQQDRVAEVIYYQGIDKLESVFVPGGILTPYVGLKFTHIFIGVEPDGYAHS